MTDIMDLSFLTPKDNRRLGKDNNLFPFMEQNTEKSSQIKEGMSINEVSEIISDRFIDLVKKQFAEIEAKTQSKQ